MMNVLNETDGTSRCIGYALAVAPEIWKGLSEKERVNVENWLGNSINEKK